MNLFGIVPRGFGPSGRTVLAFVYDISMARGPEVTMSARKNVRSIRNGRNQAVKNRDGDRLLIEPARKRGLLALLKTMKPLNEDLPQIEDPPPPSQQ